MSPTRSHGVRMFLLLSALLASAPALAGEIHEAVGAGDRDRVAALLARDAALASQIADDPTQQLPLHVAAAAGETEIAALLVEAGADINAGDIDGSTPLDVAAIRRQPGMVSWLLEQGADLNHRDRNGACAISFAVFGGDSLIVRRLIDAGADLNYRGARGTPLLHGAAMRGMGWMVDLLIERGQDPNALTDTGENALFWAARGGRPDMMERLLAAGTAVDMADTSGVTPLEMAIMFRSIEAVQVLLAHGADVNRRDPNGNTPAILASWGPDAELLSFLLENGADPNAVDGEGGRALWWTALNGNPASTDVLLKAGADADPVEPHDGRTPLHAAALGGYGDVAAMLLDRGASAATRDADGRTPLELAVRHSNDGVARLLREHGAAAEADPPRRLAKPGELARMEALVWYLGHSGWAVQTANHLLIFDYHELTRPADEPSLANGHILPGEVAGQKVTVFVSHEHGDHFNPLILDWQGRIPDLTYVFGFHPEKSRRPGLPGEYPPYEYVAPRGTRTIDGVTVTTIASTDSGEGFLVEADGVVILHPGDHANRRRDFSGPYRAEMNYLAGINARPDIAFFPISGCGFGDLEAVRMGVYDSLKALEPRVFLPMHAGNQGWKYREYIKACGDRFPATQLEALVDKGDCLHIKDGRVS